jgi:hypothetical protein
MWPPGDKNEVAQTLQDAEKLNLFVMLSEAKNDKKTASIAACKPYAIDRRKFAMLPENPAREYNSASGNII